MRAVPARLIQHENAVAARIELGGESVREQVLCRGRDLGQHEAEALAGGRAHSTVDVGPLKAAVAEAARAFAA